MGVFAHATEGQEQLDHPIEGDLLFTIANPYTETFPYFGAIITSSFDNKLIVGNPTHNEYAGLVMIYDIDTSELLTTIDNPCSYIRFGSSVITTPEGNILVAARGEGGTLYPDSGALYLFDGETYDLLLTIEGGFADSIGVTPDNNIIASSMYETANEGTVYLFNGTTGEQILKINSPARDSANLFGSSIDSTSNGDFLLSTMPQASWVANYVYLYDGISGEQLLAIPPPDGYDTWYPFVTVTADDNFVISDYKNRESNIYLYNGTSGELIFKIENSDENTYSENYVITGYTKHVITSDGNIFVSSTVTDQTQTYANLFDGNTGELLLSLDLPNRDLDPHVPIFTSVTSIGDKLITGTFSAYYLDNNRFEGAIYVFEGLAENEPPFNLDGNIFDLFSGYIQGNYSKSDRLPFPIP